MKKIKRFFVLFLAIFAFAFGNACAGPEAGSEGGSVPAATRKIYNLDLHKMASKPLGFSYPTAVGSFMGAAGSINGDTVDLTITPGPRISLPAMPGDSYMIDASYLAAQKQGDRTVMGRVKYDFAGTLGTGSAIPVEYTAQFIPDVTAGGTYSLELPPECSCVSDLACPPDLIEFLCGPGGFWAPIILGNDSCRREEDHTENGLGGCGTTVYGEVAQVTLHKKGGCLGKGYSFQDTCDAFDPVANTGGVTFGPGRYRWVVYIRADRPAWIALNICEFWTWDLIGGSWLYTQIDGQSQMFIMEFTLDEETLVKFSLQFDWPENEAMTQFTVERFEVYEWQEGADPNPPVPLKGQVVDSNGNPLEGTVSLVLDPEADLNLGEYLADPGAIEATIITQRATDDQGNFDFTDFRNVVDQAGTDKVKIVAVGPEDGNTVAVGAVRLDQASASAQVTLQAGVGEYLLGAGKWLAKKAIAGATAKAMMELAGNECPELPVWLPGKKFIYWAACYKTAGDPEPDCADFDGDGVPGETATCWGIYAGDHCDWNPKNWTINGCLSCVDADGDGRGVNCDFGNDDNDANPNCWQNCATSTCMDKDGDGFGQGTTCSTSLYDCNDSNSAFFKTWNVYRDNDRDGYGAGSQTRVCGDNSFPQGWSATAGDCNDDNSAIHPNTIDIPDNLVDENCDGHDSTNCVDLDHDGYGLNCALGADCDDTNPNIMVYRTGYRDADYDAYTLSNAQSVCSPLAQLPSGWSSSPTAAADCNDANSSIYPGAPEIPGDGIDQNCDGIDTPAPPVIQPPPSLSVNYENLVQPTMWVNWPVVSQAQNYRVYFSQDSTLSKTNYFDSVTVSTNSAQIVRTWSSGRWYFIITSLDQYGNESVASRLGWTDVP